MQPFVTRRIPLSYGSLVALLDVEPWSADATELRLSPPARGFPRWGARRQRRWFRRAHEAADQLVHHLTTGDRMSTRIGNITIDTNDLDRAADFWAAVTGYEVTSKDGGWATLAAPGGAGPGLALQDVPEPRPDGKSRVHLDVFVDDLDAAVDRIIGLGATEVEQVKDGDSRWTVLRDLEGNEFCVVAA